MTELGGAVARFSVFPTGALELRMDPTSDHLVANVVVTPESAAQAV